MPAIGMQIQGLAQPCKARGVVRPITPAVSSSTVSRQWKVTQRELRMRAEPEVSTAGLVEEDTESEAAQKRLQAERLRAAEKFMVIGAGNATCKGCGYEYKPENGDPEFPIPRGMNFQELPAEYVCPVCGANKDRFEARTKVVAGFAENQKYGLGTNAMTGDQKLILIYGALAAFFILFIGGYALE